MIVITLHTPAWMDGVTYSGQELRSILDALYLTPGVVTPSSLAVTAPGTGMTVSVAAGYAIISGTSEGMQGKYHCWSDAPDSVTIASSPGAGQSRYDLIVAQVQDTSADSSGDRDFLIFAVEGTAAATGSQVVPSTPADAIVLARVLVGPTVSDITSGALLDQRTLAATLNPGAVMGRMYQTSQDIITPGAGPAPLGNMVQDYIQGGVTFSSNRLVIPQAGIYMVSAQISYQAGGGPPGNGSYVTAIVQNTTLVRQTSAYDGGTVTYPTPTLTDYLRLSAGDTLGLYAQQNSPGNQGTTAGTQNTWLSCALIGR